MDPVELDLDSSQNLYLFPPRVSSKERELLRGHLQKLDLRGHIFILSSGTTSGGDIKGYALSKKALSANAEAVNRLLGLDESDHWLISLPPWHVGGLSVYVRAKLAGAKVFPAPSKWEPSLWAKALEGKSVSSIVPLQAYDLAKREISAPKSLRHLIVGGDHLPSRLRQSLVELGWPVRRTFGMTEVCSQLATEFAGQGMQVLDIHQVRVGEDARLKVKSPSLFSGKFRFGEDFVFKPAELDQNGYYACGDLAKLEGGFLKHLGRSDQAFKSKGRLFYFNELREKLGNYAFLKGWTGKIELFLREDPRLGKAGEVVVLEELRSSAETIKTDLKDLLAPLPLRGPVYVASLERTELGKLKHKPTR